MCASIGSGDSAVSSDSVLQSGHHTPRFGIIENREIFIPPPPLSGLLQLVCVATSNPRAGDVINDVMWKAQARGVCIYRWRNFSLTTTKVESSEDYEES